MVLARVSYKQVDSTMSTEALAMVLQSQREAAEKDNGGEEESVDNERERERERKRRRRSYE